MPVMRIFPHGGPGLSRRSNGRANRVTHGQEGKGALVKRSYLYTGLAILLVVAVLVVSATSRQPDHHSGRHPGGTKTAQSLVGSAGSAGPTAAVADLPVAGMVTMVNLGAQNCVPCRMMAPILAELTEEYQGRAVIAYIDVDINPNQAQRFGVRIIPTQIFHDAQGREISRHTGFMDKAGIVAVLAELGAGTPEQP